MLWTQRIHVRYSRDALTVGEGRDFTSLTAWRNASYRNQLGFPLAEAYKQGRLRAHHGNETEHGAVT